LIQEKDVSPRLMIKKSSFVGMGGINGVWKRLNVAVCKCSEIPISRIILYQKRGPERREVGVTLDETKSRESKKNFHLMVFGSEGRGYVEGKQETAARRRN